MARGAVLLVAFICMLATVTGAAAAAAQQQWKAQWTLLSGNNYWLANDMGWIREALRVDGMVSRRIAGVAALYGA